MKKLVLFAMLLLSVFTLSGCQEDLTEFHEAIDNTAEITNAKVTITSESMGVQISIVQYISEEAIMVHMGETIISEEVFVYGVIDDSSVSLIMKDGTGDVPYQVTELSDLDEAVSELGEYDIFKEGDFEKDGEYYIAEDVNFDVPGYEDVDEISEVKISIENDLLHEIIMTMKINGFTVVVTLTIEDVDNVTVSLPSYFEYGEVETFEDTLASFWYDFSLREDSFEIIGDGFYFAYERGDSIVNFNLNDAALLYNFDEEVFILNAVNYSYAEFLAQPECPFNASELAVIMELFGIYN